MNRQDETSYSLGSVAKIPELSSALRTSNSLTFCRFLSLISSTVMKFSIVIASFSELPLLFSAIISSILVSDIPQLSHLLSVVISCFCNAFRSRTMKIIWIKYLILTSYSFSRYDNTHFKKSPSLYCKY